MRSPSAPCSPPRCRCLSCERADVLANLSKHSLNDLTALVKTRLKRMQYRPGLIEVLVAILKDL
ncbi:hypothetical protein E6W17_38330 [Streptomyces sp. A1547]|nr:hypothetical protein E6W17_38330 [Streptomyces sp. A1547]